jgi:hypothetical protein
MATQYGNAVKYVMIRCREGARLSSFTGIHRRAAENLLDRGQLQGTRLSSGDWLLNVSENGSGYDSSYR